MSSSFVRVNGHQWVQVISIIWAGNMIYLIISYLLVSNSMKYQRWVLPLFWTSSRGKVSLYSFELVVQSALIFIDGGRRMCTPADDFLKYYNLGSLPWLFDTLISSIQSHFIFCVIILDSNSLYAGFLWFWFYYICYWCLNNC